MKIEIWSDIACPYCYVAHLNLDKAIANLPYKKHIKIIHRAYQLNPLAPLSNDLTPYQNLAKKRNISVEEAKQSYDQLTAEIKSMCGVDYRYDILKLTNTLNTHRLAKLARIFHKEHEFHSRFFRAYFCEGKHLGDTSTLVDLMTELEFDPNEIQCFLNTAQFGDLVKAEYEEAKIDRKIRGVPYILINNSLEITGSESVEVYTDYIQKAWEEENRTNVFGGLSKGECCEDDHCQ